MYTKKIRAGYSSMTDDAKQSAEQQCTLLSAFARIACAGSGSLKESKIDSMKGKSLHCTLCDGRGLIGQATKGHWNDIQHGEDWKDAVAALLVITKEPKFQESPKARVFMAVAIGRVFRHISDVDYLNLEACELGQWLLGSMSRSLRELKLAAT
jgi:serine/threonine-protein kinase ATR